MDKSLIQTYIENSYKSFIEKAFTTAIEGYLMEDPSAKIRFLHCVETATKLKEEVLKDFT
jgi:hypothetical protein